MAAAELAQILNQRLLEDYANQEEAERPRKINNKTAVVTVILVSSLLFTGITSGIAWFYDRKVTKDNFEESQIREDLTQYDVKIGKIRSLIKDERKLFAEFVKDTGVADFRETSDKFEYSAGQVVALRPWNEYLDFCNEFNATLASPMNHDQFRAMSLVASKKGHCFIGATRLEDLNYWKTPDNVDVSLGNYWAPNEPKKNVVDSLCAYLFNDGQKQQLYSTTCAGNSPAIKCFICSRRK